MLNNKAILLNSRQFKKQKHLVSDYIIKSIHPVWKNPAITLNTRYYQLGPQGQSIFFFYLPMQHETETCKLCDSCQFDPMYNTNSFVVILEEFSNQQENVKGNLKVSEAEEETILTVLDTFLACYRSNENIFYYTFQLKLLTLSIIEFCQMNCIVME